MKICQITGCETKHYAKGYCKKHYAQIKNHGRLTPEKEHEVPKSCQVEGCENKYCSKGYCIKHYHQVRYSGTSH